MLGIELERPGPSRNEAGGSAGFEWPPLLVPAASAEELAAHENMLRHIEAESKGDCLWLRGVRLEATPAKAAGGSRKA